MKSATLALLSILLLAGAHAGAAEIRVCADIWMPVNGADDAKDDERGYLIEIAEKAWGAAGHTVSYENMPWKRAIEVARAGRCDCLPAAYRVDAPDFVFPARAVGRDQPTFYTLSSNKWSYAGISSLSKKQLGVISGYTYEDAAFNTYVASALDDGRALGMSGSNASALLLDLLTAGRVNVVVDSNLVVDYAIAQRQLKNKVRAAGTLSEPVDFHMACTPANPHSADYVRQLDEGITRLRRSGELDRIMARYGLRDWEK